MKVVRYQADGLYYKDPSDVLSSTANFSQVDTLNARKDSTTRSQFLIETQHQFWGSSTK